MAESSEFVKENAERHVSSAEELQTGLRTLRAGEVDAVFEVSDSLVETHDQLVIYTAEVKKLPAMFIARNSVLKGGLASYSVSRHEVGRVSAKHVQRILSGVKPKDLPVEGVDKIALIINVVSVQQLCRKRFQH